MQHDLTVINQHVPATPHLDHIVSPQVSATAEIVGRDRELADLRAAFQAPRTGNAPMVQVLTGMGGVGKTTIARAYALRHLDDYSVVWWVRAEDPVAIDGEYRSLLELVHSAGEAKLARDAVQLATAWLAERKQPWLLILDNVPDPAAVRGLYPARGKGHVLVTSRANTWRNPAIVRAITPLDADRAVELLTSVSQDDDTESATELACELGGLPLALSQAASFTAANGIDLATYLRFYRQRGVELHADGRPDDYPHTIATTWLLAMERLPPPAQRLLDTIAYFAPDSIPMSLLAPLFDDEFALTKACGELLKHSLVTRGVKDAITVHRLVQAVTRQQHIDGAEHLNQACDLIAVALPKVPLTVQTMAEWNRLRSHAHAVVDGACSGPETFDLRYDMAFLHGDMGDMRAAQAQLESLVEDMSRVLGVENWRVFRARHGVAYWLIEAETKFSQARSLLADLLEAQNRVLGPEHPDTLITRHDFAVALRQVGERDRARRIFEELLPVRVRVLGANHRYTLITRCQVAYDLADQGWYDAAIGMFHELLVDASAALGPLDWTTINIYAALAKVLGMSGDVNGALGLYEWVVEQAVIQRGPYDRETLMEYRELAIWTATAGNPVRAVRMMVDMRMRLRASIGKNSPVVKEFEEGLKRVRVRMAHGMVGRWRGGKRTR